MYETEAIVLRAIRYGEADSVLTLYTKERGRVSAMAKGARRAKSKMGGRLQPGVRVMVGLHEGRGDMATVRHAQVVEPHAGLWVDGYRLRAASSVLEATMRVLVENEPNDAAYNLISRALAALAIAPARDGQPRLDPIVLGVHAKLLVVAGLLPRLGSCVACQATDPLVAFSARLGGGLCAACRGLGEPVDADVLQAFASLVGSPLTDAAAACPPNAAAGVERVIGLVFQEHLGVTLRSATPL